MFNRLAVKHLSVLLGHSILVWIIGNIHTVKNSKYTKKDICTASVSANCSHLATREEKQTSPKYNPENTHTPIDSLNHRHNSTFS